MFKEDGGYYRKELPSGEKNLVEIEVIYDANDMPINVKDGPVCAGHTIKGAALAVYLWPGLFLFGAISQQIGKRYKYL